ncbi:nucleotidyltransferase family protein [Nitrosopumilus sp.]|uniref:nucleotidyltransferase family protein n=1 Tax=Nitrosopumilus sp. TaxID=2024843 RepID=UPI003B5BB6F1
MKAVILTGGLGTRLQPYTLFVPKPMLPLGDKPLLEHSINWLKKNNIKSVVLCVSYLRKNIQDYFEDGKDFGVDIEYAISNKPLATAGQLKTAEEFIDDTFVCMYGDSVFDFSLKNMVKKHQKDKSFITMCLYEYKSRLPYGVIDTDKKGFITAWREKPEIVSSINTGCYVMEPGVFPYIPEDMPYGMDKVILKAMAKKKRMNSYSIKKGFTDVGDMESYTKTYKEFKEKLGKI